jgi:hypothetical protein
VARDPREKARYRAYARQLGSGKPVAVTIEHSADDACCKLETWRATEQALRGGFQIPKHLGLTDKGLWGE